MASYLLSVNHNVEGEFYTKQAICQKPIFIIFSFKNGTEPSAAEKISTSDQLFVIQDPSTGLVLDASEFVVKMKSFTASPSQLWQKKPIGAGQLFVIRNSANGNALDIADGAHENHKMITYREHGNDNQRWVLDSDGTIVSDGIDKGRRLVIQIDENTAIAKPKTRKSNQKFTFVPFDASDPERRELDDASF